MQSPQILIKIHAILPLQKVLYLKNLMYFPWSKIYRVHKHCCDSWKKFWIHKNTWKLGIQTQQKVESTPVIVTWDCIYLTGKADYYMSNSTSWQQLLYFFIHDLCELCLILDMFVFISFFYDLHFDFFILPEKILIGILPDISYSLFAAA